MEMELLDTHCCGVGDLAYICGKDVESIVLAIGMDMLESYDPGRLPCATAVFTDVKVPKRKREDTRAYGDGYAGMDGKTGLRVEAFIKEHKLGTVTSGRWTNNPYHPDHMLKTYVWVLHKSNYLAWCRKQPRFADRADYARHRRDYW